jgi:hypothetical protein
MGVVPDGTTAAVAHAGPMRRLLPVTAGLLAGGFAVQLIRWAEGAGPLALVGVLAAAAAAGGWTGWQLLQRRGGTVAPVLAGARVALVGADPFHGVRWDLPVLAANAALALAVLHTTRRPLYTRPALRLVDSRA